MTKKETDLKKFCKTEFCFNCDYNTKDGDCQASDSKGNFPHDDGWKGLER